MTRDKDGVISALLAWLSFPRSTVWRWCSRRSLPVSTSDLWWSQRCLSLLAQAWVFQKLPLLMFSPEYGSGSGHKNTSPLPLSKCSLRRPQCFWSVTVECRIYGPAGWLSVRSGIEKLLKLSVNRSRGDWDLHCCGRAETGTNQKSLSTFSAPGWLCGDPSVPSTAKPLCRDLRQMYLWKCFYLWGQLWAWRLEVNISANSHNSKTGKQSANFFFFLEQLQNL